MTNIRNSIDHLDPNITKTVHFLRSKDFNTTDSGDGVYKIENDIDEDALDFPHVFIITDIENLVPESFRLKEVLEAAGIQVFQQGLDHSTPCIQSSFDPCTDTGCIMLMGVHDGRFS